MEQEICVEENMDIEWEIEEEKMEGSMNGGVGDADADSFDIVDGNVSQTDSSIFTGDLQNPVSSEIGLRTTDSDSPPEDIERIEPKGPMLKRKAPTAEARPVKSPSLMMTKRQRICGAGEESGDEDSGRELEGLSRSAAATRRLRGLMKSGKFVADEQKKAAYEKKCIEVDAKARFRYQKKWEVLHSKCGKWFTMPEPYNTTRFKLHVEGCRSKGQNGLIDDFFKRQDGNEKGVVTRVARPAGRKHIIIGGCQPKTSIGGNPGFTSLSRVLEPKLQGCRGIGEEHHDRIPVYISRALTDGAGSRSESAITTMLFGDDIKYSQLDAESRNDVLVAQVKLRSWTICRELRVVYSTKCQNFISSGSSTTCDECLAVLKLDTFKKALRMEPPPLATAKFTPRRQYSGARDLGISYAKIKGLTGLLDDVSMVFHSHRFNISADKHRIPEDLYGFALLTVYWKANTTIRNCCLGSCMLPYREPIETNAMLGCRTSAIPLSYSKHRMCVQSSVLRFTAFFKLKCNFRLFVTTSMYSSYITRDYTDLLLEWFALENLVSRCSSVRSVS